VKVDVGDGYHGALGLGGAVVGSKPIKVIMVILVDSYRACQRLQYDRICSDCGYQLKLPVIVR